MKINAIDEFFGVPGQIKIPNCKIIILPATGVLILTIIISDLNLMNKGTKLYDWLQRWLRWLTWLRIPKNSASKTGLKRVKINLWALILSPFWNWNINEIMTIIILHFISIFICFFLSSQKLFVGGYFYVFSAFIKQTSDLYVAGSWLQKLQ